MADPVSLQAVVDELTLLHDEFESYLNPQTGEIVMLSTEEMDAVEHDAPTEDYPDWQQERIAQARHVLSTPGWLPLPTKFDVDEYAIMASFCDAQADPAIRHDLLGQIRGSGAFRRFKDALHRYGIAEQWYRFRDAELEAIAIAWLDMHRIPYRRDM